MDRAAITKLAMTFGAVAIYVVASKWLTADFHDLAILAAGSLGGGALVKRPGDVTS